MSDHLHKQIRDKIKTALTGLTTTGDRVYANRLMPMAGANLPGLRIFMDNEDAQSLTIHEPQFLERTLNLMVDCCGKPATSVGSTPLDDLLDTISKEVETALAAGIVFGATTLPIFYTGMQFQDEQSDVPVGVKILHFSITFTAKNTTPDALT